MNPLCSRSLTPTNRTPPGTRRSRALGEPNAEFKEPGFRSSNKSSALARSALQSATPESWLLTPDSCPSHSSIPFNFASTSKSSSVVVSPVTCPPAATSLSKRRMIFPLRVFGSASAKRISSGLAIAPIAAADVQSQFFSKFGRGMVFFFQRHEGHDRLAFHLIRTPNHGGFGHAGMADQGTFDFRGT